jgi:glutathione S-transferase
MPESPQMIQVFQAEWCPFSALVRERLNELDLPFVALPVPVDREARDVMQERTGTRVIPAVILEDGTVLSGDAKEIVAELDQRYPEGPNAQAHRDALAAHALSKTLP